MLHLSVIYISLSFVIIEFIQGVWEIYITAINKTLFAETS